MAKRNKKATRKIERLRDRLHHVDENPDMKVGWLTQYMFVCDNFDIGETKRANENRWLYTIGPQRRTRYPFETLIIPGSHYTLHWFMQCKITDPAQVPEFRYVPISTGATTLPFGTAPYVPTVQISQTKSDWVVVPQESFLCDAKVILQCLAKCINQHNFSIFDARDLMQSLPLKLPLISHEETICELEFLERQRKGIVIGYQNRYKRTTSPVKLEGPPSKKPRLEVTSISAATRMLLELLSYGPISISQAAARLHVKEKLVDQVVEVLSVVGQVTMSHNLIMSTVTNNSMSRSTNGITSMLSPQSPKSSQSCEDSYGPIPETPPQSMPMWDSQTSAENPSTPSRQYATRSSTLRKSETQEVKRPEAPGSPVYSTVPVIPQPNRMSVSKPPAFSAPPPTQPAIRNPNERSWLQSPDAVAPTYSGIPTGNGKPGLNDMGFEANMDLGDSSIADFFQSSFWDQY